MLKPSIVVESVNEYKKTHDNKMVILTIHLGVYVLNILPANVEPIVKPRYTKLPTKPKSAWSRVNSFIRVVVHAAIAPWSRWLKRLIMNINQKISLREDFANPRFIGVSGKGGVFSFEININNNYK
jgi:hypothetical protein